MAHPKQGPLWGQIAGETLWGRRGLVKTISLSLPLAVMLSTGWRDGGQAKWLTCLGLYAGVGCWCLACILANDLADRRQDQAADRRRWIVGLPGGMGVLAVTLLIGVGVLTLLLIGAGRPALGAYLAAAVLGVSYSVRPTRFKRRGVLGLLAYSFSAMLAFVAVPWSLLEGGLPALAVLGLAVLLDKWVNLHFHQVVDRQADGEAGVQTLAVRMGPDRARWWLQWTASLACLSMVGVVALSAVSVPSWRLAIAGTSAGAVFAVGMYAGCIRRFRERESALLRELPWTYLGLSYTAFRILPLVLLARLAVREPTMWVVFGVVALLVGLESRHALRYGSA